MSRKKYPEQPSYAWREISVLNLIKLLKNSKGANACVNVVGNLLVTDAKGKELGYIDLHKHVFETFSNED